MGKSRRLVKLRLSGSISWPQVCALCLGSATEEDGTTLPGAKIPYCDECLAKVRRLQNWKDNLFGISLIIGIILGIGSLIGLAHQEGWMALFRPQTYLMAAAGGFMFMGAAYGLMWIMMLPLRLIFRSRLAAPAVREAKSKGPGVRRLRFARTGYAQRFLEQNAGLVID